MRWECDGGAWYWGEEGRDGWCSSEGEEAMSFMSEHGAVYTITIKVKYEAFLPSGPYGVPSVMR
jgi:hypothetical protein